MRIHQLMLLFALLCSFSVAHAQRYGAFTEYTYPQFAEVIRLGSAYAAVGRGPAVMHVNSAALAFLKGKQLDVSTGRSLGENDWEYDLPLDAAATVHVPEWRMTFGASVNLDQFEWEPRWDAENLSRYTVTNRRYGLHAARSMTDWLAIGAAIMVYDSYLEAYSWAHESGTGRATFMDFALSAMSRHRVDFLGRDDDELRCMLGLSNVLSTETYYIDEAQKDPIQQVFRVGAAYFWNPDFGQAAGLDVFSALVSAESTIQGVEYEFKNWGTVAGAMEVRLLEVLMLSGGVENIIRLPESFSGWDEYPVFRYGIGIYLPLHHILNFERAVGVQFDYAHTAWNSETDSWYRFDPEKHPQQVNAFSLRLQIGAAD
ncbi:hypothetical protein KQI65_13890 [bacterium]|nr:hypothetical protein [bacterium]